MNPAPHLRLVDTHFHADLQPDPVAAVELCERERIYTVAVTNAPSVFAHTRKLVEGKSFVRAAVGLHPELVQSHAHELPDLLRLINETKYVGEVGLDYSTTDLGLRKRQRMVFEAVLDCSEGLGGRMITVHSRRAAADVVACIAPRSKNVLILHWFSGGKRDARKALDVGCLFSVNPAMVLSERATSLIADLLREHVLTETDGPFVMVGHRTAIPTDTRLVLEALGKMWGVGLIRAAEVVFENLQRALTRISGP